MISVRLVDRDAVRDGAESAFQAMSGYMSPEAESNDGEGTGNRRWKVPTADQRRPRRFSSSARTRQ